MDLMTSVTFDQAFLYTVIPCVPSSKDLAVGIFITNNATIVI